MKHQIRHTNLWISAGSLATSAVLGFFSIAFALDQYLTFYDNFENFLSAYRYIVSKLARAVDWLPFFHADTDSINAFVFFNSFVFAISFFCRFNFNLFKKELADTGHSTVPDHLRPHYDYLHSLTRSSDKFFQHISIFMYIIVFLSLFVFERREDAPSISELTIFRVLLILPVSSFFMSLLISIAAAPIFRLTLGSWFLIKLTDIWSFFWLPSFGYYSQYGLILAVLSLFVNEGNSIFDRLGATVSAILGL